MIFIFVVLALAFGFVLAAVWASLRNQRITIKTAAIPMLSCLGLALVVVALAPSRPSGEARVAQPPAPTPSVSMAALNSSLASKPMRRKWSRTEFVNVSGDSYRLYLTYGSPPASMSEVESDTIAVAKLALDVIAENGIDPWKGSTFVSVYAQRPEGSVGGKNLIRRYGNAHFSAITGQFEFKPAE